MNWTDLIGKKIVAFRGIPHNPSAYDKKLVVPFSYILFDDGETILELDKQDPYDYHDCCASARILSLSQNKELWQRMFDKKIYQEPDKVEFSWLY